MSEIRRGRRVSDQNAISGLFDATGGKIVGTHHASATGSVLWRTF